MSPSTPDSLLPPSASANPQPSPPPAVSNQEASNHGAANGDSSAPTAEASSRNPTPDQADALSQNKERARTQLAANFQAPEGSASPSTPSNQPTSQPVANGVGSSSGTASVSRKRSRSGSLKAASQGEETAGAESQSRPSVTQLYLDQYASRDQLHSQAMRRDDERYRQTMYELRTERNAWEEWRQKQNMLAARQPTEVVYISQRKHPMRRTGELRVSRKDREKQAEQLEELVPIRLDIEHDKLRLRDTFTWNLHDRVTPGNLFVQCLLEDFKIPTEHLAYFEKEIMESINEQLNDFHPHIFIHDEPLDPHLPYTAYKNDEMRILIKLNITIGNHTLVDQFDWDINNVNNSPETFAKSLSQDLALTGEFTTAIAHSIREQSQAFTKALFMSGHQWDGRPIEDSEIRDNLLPSPIPYVFRPFQSAKECAPAFYELNEIDLEKTEHAFSRDQRQQKRAVLTGRSGKPTLPEQLKATERPKTWRTQIVSSVIPGAAESVETSGLYKMRPARKKQRPARGGEEEDDDDDDDEEESESPVRGQPPSGWRISRRNAASAAQAAMRANLTTRSKSPDSPGVQDTKGMSLRFGANQIFTGPDDDGNDCMVIKLKMPRERFRQWWRDYKRKQQLQLQPSTSTPVPMGPPPTTPGMSRTPKPPDHGMNSSEETTSKPSTTPQPSTPQPQHAQTPRPPPAPAWLTSSLDALRRDWPEDRFEAVMRFHAPGEGSNKPTVAEWVPKIRCRDCPGTLYNALESDPSLGNFLQHLRHRGHVGKRMDRMERERKEKGK